MSAPRIPLTKRNLLLAELALLEMGKLPMPRSVIRLGPDEVAHVRAVRIAVVRERLRAYEDPRRR